MAATRRQMIQQVILAAGVAWGAANAHAVETRVVRDETFAQFNQGETTGIEVLANGRLKLAPTKRRAERTEDNVTWKIAVDPVDGTVFFATGNNGKVYRSAPNAKEPELWADLAESQALSLAIDPTGGLIVGSAPGGKIYRVLEAGKPTLLFDTKEQYVWDLIFDRTGTLYAATGTSGKVWRIRGRDNGEVVLDAEQTNAMGLGFDRDGRLLVAMQGRSAVLRVTEAKNQGYVLWSGTEDEVRAVASDQRTGTLFAAVNSARASGMADGTGEKDDKNSASGASGGPSAAMAALLRSAVGESGGSSGPSTGPSGSSVIQIAPNGFVSTLWQAPEGPIQAILSDPESGGVLVAAGKRGKVFRVAPDGSYSVVVDLEEPMVTALAAASGHLYLGTASKAALYDLTTTGTREGQFLSRPLNAGSTVQWGNLVYETDPAGTGSVKLEVRVGNTADATDKTWSPFHECTVVAPGIVSTGAPVAQYLQYRATLSSDGANVLDTVTAFFLPRNAAPVVKDIDFVKPGADSGLAGPGGAGPAGRQAPTASQNRSGSGMMLNSPSSQQSGADNAAMALARLAMLGSMGGRSASGTETAADRPGGINLAVPQNNQRMLLTWDATDPNNDRLRFTVWIKGEDEASWKLLERDVNTNNLMLATDTLADGRYRVRVDASDVDSNVPEMATTGTAISRVVTVDNTPPVFEQVGAERLGDGSIRVTVTVADATSVLAAGEYTLDSMKEPRLVLPVDGIFDSPREQIRIVVRPDAPLPEHVVTLRVYDREGNSRVAKVLVR